MERNKGMLRGFNNYIKKFENNIPPLTEKDPIWKLVVQAMGRQKAHRLDNSATLFNAENSTKDSISIYENVEAGTDDEVVDSLTQ